MFAGNSHGFAGKRCNLAHSETLRHQLLTKRHDAAAETRHQATEQTTAARTLAIELGDQFRRAGDGLDHLGNRTVIGFALQKTEHHADRLFGNIRGQADIVGNAGYQFVHKRLLGDKY